MKKQCVNALPNVTSLLGAQCPLANHLTACSASHGHRPPSSLQPWLTWLIFIHSRDMMVTRQMPLFEADRKHCLCWKISFCHEVTEIFWNVTCSEKLLSRGLPSPPAFASVSYLHTAHALHLGFQYVCCLNLQNISQTFLYENCFVVH